jgi:hypothetical protein
MIYNLSFSFAIQQIYWCPQNEMSKIALNGYR